MSWKTSHARPIWLNAIVSMLIQLFNLFPIFIVKWNYITGDHMLTLSYIFSGLMSSTFVSDLYGLIQRILYLIVLVHTTMWPCYWSNTVLLQMVLYMEFHICMQHDYWACIYLQPYSRGKLVLYIWIYYIYSFASAFANVFITNPRYVLLGESDHVQILIFPEYNFLTYLLLREFQMLLQPKCPTKSRIFQHRFV